VVDPEPGRELLSEGLEAVEEEVGLIVAVDANGPLRVDRSGYLILSLTIGVAIVQMTIVPIG
jgi:hypothetical protein